MPGKSAGVGAGGVVSTKLQAATSERDETRRSRAAAGGVGTSSRRLPPATPGAVERSAPRRLSGRGRGAWRRGGGPSCREPRPAAAAGAGGGGAAAARRRARRGRSARSRPVAAGRAADGGAGWRGSRDAARSVARLERVRIAARASLVRARPLAASSPSAVAVRGAAARRRRPMPADPAARRRQLAPPERHPPQGDVERPQQQRQDQQQRPQLGEPVRGGQVVASTGPAAVAIDRPAGRRPQRGEERLVGAEQPVLGRGRRDQPDRPPERRRPRPRLRDPDGVRARLDLAERRLVDARARPGRGSTVARLEVRPDDRRARRVEVARRAVGRRRSRRAASVVPPVVSNVASMPPVSSPGNVQLTELAEEPVEARSSRPSPSPSARSSPTSRRPTAPARTATGRGADRRAP